MQDTPMVSLDIENTNAIEPCAATRTYGFIVDTGRWADCDAVFAHIVVRAGNTPFPRNPRSEGESTIWDAPKRLEGLLLYNLHMRAYVSPYADGQLFTHISIQYDNLYSVPLRTAEQAVKTLLRIERQIEKAQAQEAGDMIMAFGAALGLSFYTAKRPGEDGVPARQSGRTYSDDSWLFGPLAEARDAFRTQLAAIQKRQPAGR